MCIHSQYVLNSLDCWKCHFPFKYLIRIGYLFVSLCITYWVSLKVATVTTNWEKKLSRSQEQSFTSPSVYDSVSWGLKAGPFPSLWDQAAEATLIWDIDCHFCSGGKTWWNHVRLFIKAFVWNCTLLQFTFHYPNKPHGQSWCE